MSEKIPKVFHQIWLQGELPDLYKKLRDRMMKIHPGWEYKLWTEHDRIKLENEEFYKEIHSFAFKSDILRYELLLKYGGVYVDTDFLFMKNLDILLDQEIFLVDEYDRNPVKSRHFLNNCVIGCPPNHYFLQYVVLKLKESYESYKAIKNSGGRPNGWDLVGPVFLDRCYNSIFSSPVFCCPKSFFCPFRPADIIRFGGFTKCINMLPEETIAMHLWNSNFKIEDMDLTV